jgi:hypothetical protein
MALHEDDYKKLKGGCRNIFAKLKKQYEELFGKKYSYDVSNLELNSTLELASKKYGLTFNIYSYSKEQNKYELEYTVGDNKKNKVNLLFVNTTDLNKNHIQHVMYIKNLDSLTKLHVCPKCQYIPPASDHNNYDKSRFEEHVKKCDGKLHKELSLNDVPTPYIPHIQKTSFLHFYCLIID